MTCSHILIRIYYHVTIEGVIYVLFFNPSLYIVVVDVN